MSRADVREVCSPLVLLGIVTDKRHWLEAGWLVSDVDLKNGIKNTLYIKNAMKKI